MSDAPITDKFRKDAPLIMQALISELKDYDLSSEDAAAILGNFGVETGGFSLRLEEGKEKANQGYGWAQWTGYDPDASDRRLLFEEWCIDNGFSNVVSNPSTSPDEQYEAACYEYFVHEISETWEERVLTDGATISGTYYPPLSECKSLDEKTIAFMKVFERPGTPHEDWRKEMAHEALRLYDELDAPLPAPEDEGVPRVDIVISGDVVVFVNGQHIVLPDPQPGD